MKDIQKIFIEMVKLIHQYKCNIPISLKDNYSSLEIAQGINHLEKKYLPALLQNEHQKLINYFCKGKRDILIANICEIANNYETMINENKDKQFDYSNILPFLKRIL